MLEVGCGDGRNLTALAVAYPRATFTGFDLASFPVERGRELIVEAGLTNIDLVVMDACDAPAHFPPSSFDYIIAHGVYAWVPVPVREAVMRLIGSALSPHGVAFISYNSLPGGYIRMAMRDMLMLEVGSIEDPDTKIAATVAFLEGLSGMEPSADPSIRDIQAQATSMLDRPTNLLFHDELGECFYPQRLTDVTSAASQAGLRFLSDAGRNRHFDGFLDAAQEMPADAETEVLRSAQMDDYLTMRYFRQTLLVRDEAQPKRLIDTDYLADLWVSTKATFDAETGLFAVGKTQLEFDGETDFTEPMCRIVEAGIRRIPIAGLIEDPRRRAILLRLFNEWAVQFHTGPPPFATEVGDKPLSSPLARIEIARDQNRLCTLDHRIIEIDQPGLRALIGAANGERTISEIAAMVVLEFPDERIPAAYDACAARGLMVR